MKFFAAALVAIATAAAFAGVPAAQLDQTIPHYAHIFVIIEENKDYAQIMSAAHAPHIAALAKEYGVATRFYAEAHPSEPNYIALVGGDTFGIRDDDAYYCTSEDEGYLLRESHAIRLRQSYGQRS